MKLIANYVAIFYNVNILKIYLKNRVKKGEKMAKKVVIEESECIACGSCAEICPEVFVLEDDAEAARIIQPIGGPEDLIQEAIDSCPTSCIRWED